MESDFLNSDQGRSLLPILSEAGYEEGDFLPLLSMGSPDVRISSTTSTTYVRADELTFYWLKWDNIPVPSESMRIYSTARVYPGTDETVDVRWYNLHASETLAEKTGITGDQMVEFGPLSYTPPRTDLTYGYTWEIRTSPGTNASELQGFYMAFGVVL